MRPRRERQDPFQPRSTVAGVLAEARASLLNPSRPYTPAVNSRHLLDDAQHSNFPRGNFAAGAGGPMGENRPAYGDRPSSAFNFKEFSGSSGSTMDSTMDMAASLDRFDRMRASAESSGLASFDDEDVAPRGGKGELEMRRSADAGQQQDRAAASPAATPPSSATDFARPISSHGQRDRSTVDRQVIEHPAEHLEPSPPPKSKQLAEDASSAAENEQAPVESSATTKMLEQLAAAADGEEVMRLLSELSEHVTSAEYREEAACTGIYRTVAGRLARMVEQHSDNPKLLLRIARIMMQV